MLVLDVKVSFIVTKYSLPILYYFDFYTRFNKFMRFFLFIMLHFKLLWFVRFPEIKKPDI